MKILDWIKCKLGYHDYLVVKNLSIRCQKISCSRCKKLWAVNHEMRAILPWDYELECLYKMLEEQVESEVDKRTERIENDTKILLNTIYQDFEKQKEQIACEAFGEGFNKGHRFMISGVDEEEAFEDYKKSKGDK
jgi:hypothetical protein